MLGSGLGLAIVRQVVLQQGGSIAAEGPSDGGTLMRMRLPGAEPVIVAGAEDPARQETPARGLYDGSSV